MSSFYCPKCSKEIIDTPGKGYITGCIHFPLKKENPMEMPEFMKVVFDYK